MNTTDTQFEILLNYPGRFNASYNRKSTEDKNNQVQSVDDQVNENTKTAVSMNEEIFHHFKDEKSGLTPNIRPNFAKLIILIRHRKIRLLYCWKLNRLARNMEEGGVIIELLQKGFFDAIVTPKKIYFPTERTSVLASEFSEANQFSRDLSDDVKRGLRTKNEKGAKPGRSNLGYLNDPYELKGLKKILVDELKFPLLRLVWDKALTGQYSYLELAKYADSIGLKGRMGKTITKSTIERTLNNPFYYGEYYYKGVLYYGSHKPMITRDEFEYLQIVFKNRKRSRPQKHQNKYNGLFKCGECGYSIIPEPLKYKYIKSTNKVKAYKYWRCSHKNLTKNDCKQKCIREDILEKQISTYLENIELSDSFIEWGMKYLNTFIGEEFVDRQKLFDLETKRLEDIQISLDRLTKLFISPLNAHGELLNEEQFKKQKDDIETEKTTILSNLNKINKRQDDVIVRLINHLQFCKNITYKFNHGTIEEKKSILIELGRTMTIKDGIVTLVSDVEFLRFKEIEKMTIVNNEWLELTPDNKDKDIELYNKIKSFISG